MTSYGPGAPQHESLLIIVIIMTMSITNCAFTTPSNETKSATYIFSDTYKYGVGIIVYHVTDEKTEPRITQLISGCTGI